MSAPEPSDRPAGALTRWWRRRSSRQRIVLLVGVVPAVCALVVLQYLLFLRPEPPTPKPPVETFTGLLDRIDDKKISELEIDPAALTVTVTETDKDISSYVIGIPGQAGNEDLLDAADDAGIDISSTPVGGDEGDGTLLKLLTVLPGLIIVIVLLVALRVMRPNAKRLYRQKDDTEVTFADVAGCGEAVEELADVREFLADPKRFAMLGARVPKGVLMFGPPGTGKTLLARALATEAHAAFFRVSGSDFMEMFVGVGANRVRSLFAEAKKVNGPAIIFIDEIDAVGKARGSGGDGGTQEADRTLTQLLTEMDGFDVAEHPLIVVAATNHPDALDPALLRPGRFDRQVAIDPPDKAGRRAIIAVHAKDKKLADDVDLDALAEHTAGMTGAELANILNETVLEAAKRQADQATEDDLENAFFKIVAGAKKQSRALSEHERKVVAYHEAGHAIAGEQLAAADKVHKISIIPRGRSGGQTVLVSEEDVFLHQRGALLDRIVWTLAGRAAEELVFDDITTGAGDDLQRATGLIWKMLAELGMGETIGLRVTDPKHPLSPDVQAQFDHEARLMLEGQYQRALALLDEQRDTLDRVAAALLDEEVIGRDRFLELLGGSAA